MPEAPNELDFIKLGVQERIDLIAKKLLEIDPMLPTHLGFIHKELIQYEELVHLLSDEEIKNLVAGQKKHAGVQLVKESIKTKSTGSKSKTTLDML